MAAFALRQTATFHLGASLAIHFALLGLALWKTAPAPRVNPEPRVSILTEVPAAPIRGRSKGSAGSGQNRIRSNQPRLSLRDLAPQFARDGFTRPSSPPAREFHEPPGFAEISNPTSRELLFTDTRVSQAFAALAQRVDQYLDFPEILVEQGVQGEASLDLYFDSEGRVDERQSRCTGDHRLVRGLLIGAMRKALLQWLTQDASRLRPEQFRNQHFHADFVISYALQNASQSSNPAPNSYSFLRRRFRDTCLAPAVGAVHLNLACAAARLVGTVREGLDSAYHSRFVALTDILEHYDQQELRGIGALVRDSGIPG